MLVLRRSALDALTSALQRHAASITQQRQALFDADDAKAFHKNVTGLLHRAALLDRSLGALDRPAFQIANFYPFPLAYGFRLLDSYSVPSERYREQLRVGENLLAFLGSICLAILQEQDRPAANIDVREAWQGGISPGHWREIIRRCATVFMTYDDHPLASAVVNLRISGEAKGFGPKIAAMIKAKNDYKHDRGPRTDEDYESGTKASQETLTSCFEDLRFLMDYPIRMVRDVNAERRSRRVNLTCLILVGDHPGLPQEIIPHDRALPKNDLFIDLGRLGWTPLYPYIVVAHCPSCRTRETYFIDRWDRKNLTYKSFERGHTGVSPQGTEMLESWPTER